MLSASIMALMPALALQIAKPRPNTKAKLRPALVLPTMRVTCSSTIVHGPLVKPKPQRLPERPAAFGFDGLRRDRRRLGGADCLAATGRIAPDGTSLLG